jgi:hypothetical protein
MNYLLSLMFALIISAITFAVVAAWRRPARLLVLLTAFSLTASAQNWSTFLTSSRATDWTSAGFTIPSYTAACSTQPSLTAGSGAASANATSMQNSINSCDATHNVVNISAGTWYFTNLPIQKSSVVIRGAGPKSTTLIPTVGYGCAGGIQDGICMVDTNDINYATGQVLPSGGTQCSWTSGYSQGATTITLSTCGAPPPVG